MKLENMTKQAEDFRTAADAALSRLRAAKEERERREREEAEARLPRLPFRIETVRARGFASSLRFTASGAPVRVLEEDGDVILAVVNGREEILSAGEVLPFSRLSVSVSFRALRAVEFSADYLPGADRRAPAYALRGKGLSVVIFRGRLSVVFRKRRGTVNYYAPVTEEEAEAVLRGTKSLYYVKGGRGYEIR